ncbi:bifunctional aspartate kinase/homoserine dehydrogenase I [Treponema parvum]|uniref:bifunctional aspartate kinase/homoserine dehydrogenase I n=1 Tax=Treponema parvum TaxID=138851 RepID=UPI001AEBB3D3|nr:bifunctional aspartate kinase/homoserine dehydrogenase I [Treponema parvum]QTQ16470.1 bifunctional aspartate kinase/homoserine dehydrogenase I [Treponema parvum]
MITLKFGGTSMASASRIMNSSDIIIGRAKKTRVSVIVSAVAGISNSLQESIDSCIKDDLSEKFVTHVRSVHESICRELESELPGFEAASVMQKIEPLLAEYKKLLQGITVFGECPETVHCRIMGMGELMSSPVMEAVLRAKKQSVVLLDSRKFIITNGDQKEGDPDYVSTGSLLQPYRDGEDKSQTQILLFPGFICSWIGGTGKEPVPGLLGRNGSDFSASIIGSSLGAEKVEFWTDVDGIYTADPRIVKDALVVDDMSYEEAMELSFFGSKILHPKTLAPLAAKNIEAWSLNSLKPSVRGTRIGRGPFEKSGAVEKNAVRGISCLKNASMISVSGTGMKGRAGMASRVFAAVSRVGVSILLITQSSSEYTISFCVHSAQANEACDSLAKEFELEIQEGIIDPVEIQKDCAIVSVVGDGMIEKRGTAGKFFDSLATYGINIIAIAQGSSERCISCVIKGDSGDLAVRAAHVFFFHSSQSIQLFVFGAGGIGGVLLDQICAQQKKLLADQNIEIKVMVIARSKFMAMDPYGIKLKAWKETLAASEKKTGIEDVLKFVNETKPLNPVFVDCTASYEIAERYVDLLNMGMHIVTPNKRANSMSMDYYRSIRSAANTMHRRFLYETNVGAGLPIIDTLQNLFKSGDRLTEFKGIMSGSLSYIFGQLDEDVPFSRAVIEAKEKKFTEPDPRDDLSGMDVARKALIIAREAGLEIELSDIVINRVFPDDFNTEGSVDEFLRRLPEIDSYFTKKMIALKKQGKVLRMGASIRDGKCFVGMLEVTADDPLYGVKGGENAFVFHTERYNPIPLTVRGYGAGAAVTAAGVFGDILRTVNFNSEL